MLGSRADSLCALRAPTRASLGGVEPTCLSQKQHFCWSSSVTGPLAGVRERTVGYETRGRAGPQGCTQGALSCSQPRSGSVGCLFLPSDTMVHHPPPPRTHKRFLVSDQAETVLNTFLGFHKSLHLTGKKKNSLGESGTGSKLYSVVRGKSCHYFCQPCCTDKNSALRVPGYFSSWQLCGLQRPCVNPALHSKTQLCEPGV